LPSLGICESFSYSFIRSFIIHLFSLYQTSGSIGKNDEYTKHTQNTQVHMRSKERNISTLA